MEPRAFAANGGLGVPGAGLFCSVVWHNVMFCYFSVEMHDAFYISLAFIFPRGLNNNIQQLMFFPLSAVVI